jgi:hypothetical protein
MDLLDALPIIQQYISLDAVLRSVHICTRHAARLSFSLWERYTRSMRM